MTAPRLSPAQLAEIELASVDKKEFRLDGLRERVLGRAAH